MDFFNKIESIKFRIPVEFFPKWSRTLNSVNSGNLINHTSMNSVQFQDLLCCLFVVGAVLASWSLTQEVAGSNSLFKIKYFVTKFSEFSENI